jgi:hypothetical protein
LPVAWWLWATGGWLTLPLEIVAALAVAMLDSMCIYRIANPCRRIVAGYINWYLAQEPKG